MSLSAEYCSDKTGDRGGGGGALALQRRLIRGLLVWASLLTLGLAASLTLHFIHRESPASEKLKDPGNPIPEKIGMDINLMSFSPSWAEKEMVEILQWKTARIGFIEGKTQLTVKDDGLYFLYLQVTLDAQKTENYTITVESQNRGVILKGFINTSQRSTGFMGTAISLNSKETFNVTCHPKAKIHTLYTETFLGVIKLRSF